MDKLTAAERHSIKQALIAFKQFWNATIALDEESKAEKLIDIVVELAKLVESKDD